MRAIFRARMTSVAEAGIERPPSGGLRGGHGRDIEQPPQLGRAALGQPAMVLSTDTHRTIKPLPET